MSYKSNVPNRFLDRFINQIEGEGQFRILDVGCGIGDAALRLASLGHQVMGVSSSDADIEAAKRHARRIGTGNCTFETMDARDISTKFDKGFFRAVLVSDMLHLMSKDDSLATIESAKELTDSQGYNVIRGYLVDPEKSISERNIERMFHPGELCELYSTGPDWRIIDSTEGRFTSSLYMGKERVSSHADLIARKQS